VLKREKETEAHSGSSEQPEVAPVAEVGPATKLLPIPIAAEADRGAHEQQPTPLEETWKNSSGRPRIKWSKLGRVVRSGIFGHSYARR
jgi:hypothetical protein